MPARDMARYGLLIQRGGVWKGTRVVPEAWLRDALRPSQDLNRGYGYLWWLLGIKKDRPGRDVPADLVAALGAKDQKIYVCPSLDVVLVRQGDAAKDATEAESEFDNVLIGGLLAARAGGKAR